MLFSLCWLSHTRGDARLCENQRQLFIHQTCGGMLSVLRLICSVRVANLFRQWKASGFDDGQMPNFVDAAKLCSPSCKEWLPTLGSFVLACSKSGDWLEEVTHAQKAFQGGSQGAWLGEEFLSRLRILRGPSDGLRFRRGTLAQCCNAIIEWC